MHGNLIESSIYELDLSLRIDFVICNRQQDVRAAEIDKVDMHSSFRPGDIVRALVVSFMLRYKCLS